MTDYRKRLDDFAKGGAIYGLVWGDETSVRADLSKLLSEGERMREAETGYRMALADVAVQAGRYERGEIGGQELADTVGFTARQALGDPDQ